MGSVTTFADLYPIPYVKEFSVYKLLSAAVLPNKVTPQWSVKSVGDIPVATLYAQHRKVVLAVGWVDPAVTDGALTEVYIDMDSLKPQYAAYTNTVNVLLQSLGDTTLDTTAAWPMKQLNYVKYSDVCQIGYKAMLVRRGFVDPDGYPREELRDIELTRPGYSTKLGSIHTHCLVSVNGFFHQTDTDGTRAYVVEGGRSVQHGHCAHIGLTSFSSIGAVRKLPIAPEAIAAKQADAPMKDGIHFSVPEDLTGCSVALVLGGYLIFPEESIFYPVGDGCFELNIDRLPYLERIIESSHWIDLSSLGLTKSPINEMLFNPTELWSDAVLTKYLLLSQSFLVVIENDSVFTNKLHLRQANFPGFFTCLEKPVYPLIASFGRCAEYWRTYEDRFWTITAMDTFRRNYVFNRQSENTLVNVTNQLAPDVPYQKSLSYLLEIGAIGG